MKAILQDCSLLELSRLVADAGEKPFRAGQLAEGLLQGKRISEIPVPAALKAYLLERFEEEPVRIERVFTAVDGTKKYLFALADEAYAVENAVPELKAAATGVIGRNDADSVARWLQSHWQG